MPALGCICLQPYEQAIFVATTGTRIRTPLNGKCDSDRLMPEKRSQGSSSEPAQGTKLMRRHGSDGADGFGGKTRYAGPRPIRLMSSRSACRASQTLGLNSSRRLAARLEDARPRRAVLSFSTLRPGRSPARSDLFSFAPSRLPSQAGRSPIHNSNPKGPRPSSHSARPAE
jgi:hypothetical protein